MKTNTHKVALIITVALGLLSREAVMAGQSMPQDLRDARQESQLWTTFALCPNLRGNDLKVSVLKGKVTLTGVVEESVNKELAQQIAMGMDGSVDVDNQIVVQASYLTPLRTLRRGYGDMIDDAIISSAVKSKMMWSRYANGMSTVVATRMGKVFIRGPAESASSKALAGSMAMDTPGVFEVDNQMVIAAPEPRLVLAQQADASDSWITSKVKATFLFSSNMDGSNITVVTSNGMVTLSGTVGSAAERLLAIGMASNIRGVNGVHSSELILS